SVPLVTTTPASDITQTSAQLGGDVTFHGGANVTARGVCWSISPGPTLADNTTNEGSGIGSFASSLTGLTMFTTYYVRAYATNSEGTGYGDEISFTTLWDNSTVTDYDGNVYNTVQIGSQIWIATNLYVTHYGDGAAIPLVEDEVEWDSLGHSDRAYCWYNNNSLYGNTLGALYTWFTATNGDSSSLNPSGLQGVCPDGWHLPSDEEWKDLEMALGMSRDEADKTGFRGTDEGGKLKHTDALYWATPNSGATNESGFGGRAAGNRGFLGDFQNFGYYAPFWSATQNDSKQAWTRVLIYNDAKVQRNPLTKTNGFAVRCARD
ncbi:MAG: fibrobacter succinogenes major paralogous domain-containing protein, partial [Bacteroidales bacterium]|nr:fibrobacter succinogenes major paralogous domain-containing protein [Bacteroidales bacterium]